MEQIVAVEGNWAAAVGKNLAAGHRAAGTKDKPQCLREGHTAFALADSQGSLGSWRN